MGKDKGSNATAIVALVIIVLLLVLWGLLMRPSEPEYIAPPVAADTVAAKAAPEKKAKEKKKNPATRQRPKARDFLDEPVAR
ncbi:MAG: hypothetical protein J6J93_05515 [Muribaculaceae bacterium]|nr:hypothetical protein [Muribaculaceae bacterium]